MDLKRRPGRGARAREGSEGLVQAVVLLLCFLGAGLAGCVAVKLAGEDGAQTLDAYLQGYIELLREGGAAQASLLSVAWELCRWPLLVLLLGFTALGAAAIPAAFCARGFLLAYSIAAFVRVFGARGLPCALAVFGMTALASLPALFCVGALSFQSSLRLAAGVLEGRREAGVSLERLWGLVPCGMLLALGTALQYSLVPQLLPLAAELL